jgi:hypothetical protein
MLTVAVSHKQRHTPNAEPMVALRVPAEALMLKLKSLQPQNLLLPKRNSDR